MSDNLFEFYPPPGVKAKKLRGPLVRSRSGFIAAIRKHRIASAAGDHGAVTLWRRDDGAYGTMFSVWMSTKAQATHTSMRSVSKWLDEWMPHMRETQP